MPRLRRFSIAFTFAPALLLAWAPLEATAQDAAAPAAAAPAEASTKPEDAVYLDEPTPAPEPTIVQEGPVKEEYEPGKTRVERHVRKLSDDQIVNHGKFTEYYRSGQKFAEGNYQAGVHEGSWSFWHENGQLSKTVNFSKGVPDGAWEVFRADGTLLSKRAYKAGLRDGAWVAYGDDGKTPTLEQTYVDGKLAGNVTVYYKSGKPRIQSMFKDGLRDGVVAEYDESGRKTAEANYVAGKLEGKLVRYAADGTTTEEHYKDNKRVPAGAPAEAAPTPPPAS